MTDYLNTAFEIPSDWQSLLLRSPFAWFIPVALLLFSLWLIYPWFRRGRAERQVRATIQRMGKSALFDVSLDNGMEGFVFIDYLVLTATQILVVTLMRTRGIIFGGEKIDTWARVVGRHTFKFPNPLVGSQERVLAVKYHVPDAEVHGVVLFDDGCTFPKGKPEGILLPQEIPTDANQWEQAVVPARLQAAWDELAEMAHHGQQAYGRDVQVLRGQQSRAREAVAVVLLLLAVAWSGLHLLA